ncbi:MAG: LemA family protein [Methanosphaera stadtmanae]|nr:LemA family protein [Methanosphaera stadtmanae]
MSILLIIILIIIIVIAFLLVKYYNDLVNGRNHVENAWSQIDVQLQRRNDLIPNIVETVKGYASHEKDTFNQVTQARANMANATTVQEVAEADTMLTSALKSLFAVSEAYPELKANQNFIELQQELSETEDKISYARQFYNDSVLKYNNLCQQFPSSIVASLFHFDKAEFFEAQEGTRAAPKVQF